MVKAAMRLVVIFFALVGLGAAEPLTLSEAVRRALEAHPDLRVAASSVEAQTARLRSAKAPFFPTFNATVGARRSGASGQPGGQNLIRSGEVNTFSYGFNARQQLLDFGLTHHRARSAEAELVAARADLEEAAQAVILRVLEAYFQILREAQSVEINQANLTNAETQLEQARGFLEAGTRAKIEVTRAEADMANAKVGLIQAQNALRRARVSLATSMGQPQLWELEPQPLELPSPGWERESALEKALLERPDLVALEARVLAAKAGVRAAVADYRPVVAANGSYSWSDELFPPIQTNWNVGVSLEVPLFNEPTLGAAVQLAEANLEGAEGRFQALQLQVRQEVAEGVLNLDEARQRKVAAEAGRAAAEESFRLASERYRVGVGSSVEVTQAQRALVEARAQQVQARFDVELAIGRLYRAAGMLRPSLFKAR